MNTCIARILLLVLLLLARVAAPAVAAELPTIRIGILQYGTVSWELEVMTRERGPHLAVLFGGVLLLAGLWLWVILQDPASGGPTLLFAVVTYLIAATVIGITATVIGRRARSVSL